MLENILFIASLLAVIWMIDKGVKNFILVRSPREKLKQKVRSQVAESTGLSVHRKSYDTAVLTGHYQNHWVKIYTQNTLFGGEALIGIVTLENSSDINLKLETGISASTKKAFTLMLTPAAKNSFEKFVQVSGKSKAMMNSIFHEDKLQHLVRQLHQTTGGVSITIYKNQAKIRLREGLIFSSSKRKTLLMTLLNTLIALANEIDSTKQAQHAI